MPFGELFTALQQGVVDGQENPMVIIYTSKFYEVQKYLSLTGHFYAPAVLLINKAFWENTLTEEQRKIFKECEQEAKTWERQFSTKGEQELAAKLKEAGMEVIEPDKDKWIEATKPIYQQFEDRLQRDERKSY
jgi:TRAP-type C4-dicarboxylate transport system substrate-binding protein